MDDHHFYCIFTVDSNPLLELLVEEVENCRTCFPPKSHLEFCFTLNGRLHRDVITVVPSAAIELGYLMYSHHYDFWGPLTQNMM